MDTHVEAESLSEEQRPEQESKPYSRRIFWLRLFAFLIVPALFVGVLVVGLVRTSPRDLVGKSAPEFELRILGSDETLSSGDLKGSPVVVNFWASWCIPCREEAPTLEQKWRKYREQGIRLVGVNVQDADHRWRFVSVGAGEQIGSRGATKILGAISPAVLESQIQLLLDRKRNG